MSVKITSTAGPAKTALDEILKSANKLTAKVGWFPSAKYPDGTPVAQVAAWNEFGVHARPFMRPTIAAKQTEWKVQLKRELKRVTNGKQSVADAMESVASTADGAFRKAISEVTAPPLSLATIRARAKSRGKKSIAGVSTKPLVDTRLMINTLTHTVEESI
jgi:hypothetical protein